MLEGRDFDEDKNFLGVSQRNSLISLKKYFTIA